MRIAVDATALLDPPTGVGVFVRELLAGLTGVSGGVEVSAFGVSRRADELGSLVPPGVEVRTRPVPARLLRALWRRGDRPDAFALGARGDVVHGPNHVVPPAAGAAEIVTVHDLTAVHHPELCTAVVREWPDLLDRAVRRGVWIHTPTDFVADEVRERWPAAADRVVAIHHGLRRASPESPADAAAREAEGRRRAGSRRYVLAVGTVEPRKDLPSLIRSFDAIAAERPDVQLVVAGPDGWGVEAFLSAWRASPFRRRIRRIGWVSSAERAALIRGASVLAHPSLYEGFGLVPLEALDLGTPVVATRIGAVEEVTGDAAVLVEPGDVEAFAGALAGVLDDPSTAEPHLARAEERLAASTWERAIEEMIALYRRAVGT